jgi:hypothetical protein
MTRRVIRSVGLTLVAVALALVPGIGSAALIGDVTAVLTILPDPPGPEIFNSTATLGAGPEFTGNGAQAAWSLDFTATGFVLTADCADVNTDDCAFDGLRLSLSSLDFSPLAALVGVTGLAGTLVDEAFPGAPSVVVTASSVIIELTNSDFGFFFIGSGGPETALEGTFVVQPVAVVPLPATLLVLSLGALATGALALRRTRG